MSKSARSLGDPAPKLSDIRNPLSDAEGASSIHVYGPDARQPTPPGESEGNRVAVVGSPASRSLSPTVHRAAYAAMGLRWDCEAIECDEPALPAFVD